MKLPGFCSVLLLALQASLLSSSMAESPQDRTQETYLQCLIDSSDPSSPPISPLIFFPSSPSYSSVLRSYVRNLRFNSSSTPKPLFIVTPSHVSHIQATIVCSKIHGLEVRIRSGGHDYDGLSYVSRAPFVVVDMFNLRSVDVDAEGGTAWVESGATVGEVYYAIAAKSGVHAFPAGVCPTVGVGGHLSGGGYGNLMRKHGLSVDNVVDAVVVDASGRVLDRESMGDDMFWAIRGGGGASFGVIVSWKIKLVSVPEVVTVFKVEKTLEQGATEVLHRWQYVADKIDERLFIRVVLIPVVRKDQRTAKAKFVALFLGGADELLDVMSQRFPEFKLESKDCIEMSWIESVLFWSNYPKGTSPNVLLQRIPESEKFLKKKSDYVQEPISKEGLEGIWQKMMELQKPALTFNPYGGRMSEISESETPFPHRAGNIFKIQYSVTWKEEGDEALNRNLHRIRSLYTHMTPFVAKSPRSSYLNYRDTDLGINQIGNESYSQASIWGTKYFKGNFDRLVQVKTMVDPGNFFRYEQSIPCVSSWPNRMAE
ncbi:berberine bridge enzyme-like 8 [Rhodamnia argentea]|uniref:Berberine bridge enzyme-like 8 n=1 Tax=Rhodamnia argentea TaxID=178133 RepID=A0A8B8NCH7_9MYRT|nr:berberine bridge enzyme-like 8 [Rhodamnia argentea]